MAEYEFEIDTDLSPDRVMDALLDFTERRPELWPDVAPELYEVRSVGESSAEVKEGSVLPGIKIWALERYEWSRPDDWSQPGTVSWGAIESNFCAPGSGVDLEIARAASGGSHIHGRWHREPTSFAGRILIGFVALSRGKLISGSLKKNLDRMAAEGAPG